MTAQDAVPPSRPPVPPLLTAEQYLGLVRMLLEALDRTEPPELLTSGDEATDSDRLELLMTLGALEYEVAACARAAVCLLNGGLPATAVLQARKAWECAVTAQWLQHHPHLARAPIGTWQYNTGKLLLRIEKIGWALPDDVREARDRFENPIPSLVPFDQRCAHFVDADQLYATYQKMSGWCHADHGALGPHIVASASSPIGVALLADPPVESTRCLVPLTNALLWSASAVDDTVAGCPRRPVLDAVSATLWIPARLTPSTSP